MPTHRPPLAGLAAVAGADAALRTVTELVGKSSVELVGPSGVRAFVAAAIVAKQPIVVVTATGREADDLTVELEEMLGPAVAQFPSWETLPHERLSPGADTVGRRLEVLRRLAHPEDPAFPAPLRAVVTTVRSLMQPMAGSLGDIEPIVLRVGAELDFDELLTRLVEFAYSRVDMVGKRGEFAVRGGILDLFPPTADHPVRVEFWGDEVTELRPFAVADQRSLTEVSVDVVVAPPCRELLLTADVRARAAEVAVDYAADAALVEMLEKLANGVPVDGMEALLPVLKPGELRLLTEVLPEGTHLLLCDPEKIRTRAADLVRTGEEFLEASWTAASFGADAPLGAHGLDLAASGYQALPDVHASADERDLPWWTLSPLTAGTPAEVVLPVLAGPTARGSDELVATIFASLRAHVATGGAPWSSSPDTVRRNAFWNASATPTCQLRHWNPVPNRATGSSACCAARCTTV